MSSNSTRALDCLIAIGALCIKKLSRWLTVLMLGCCCLLAHASDFDSDSNFDTDTGRNFGNLTLLPQIAVSDGYGGGIVPDKDELPGVEIDILHTYQNAWFRSIIEYRADTDGVTSLERFQVGVRLPSDTYIWLGKFHSLNDYWLENYHEGAYLSPSITTPFSSSAGYEGGLTSSHQSGIKVEHYRAFGQGQIDLEASVGLTAPLSNLENSPSITRLYEDFDTDSLAYAAKVAYLPNVIENTEFGLTYAQGEEGFNQQELVEELGPFLASVIEGTRLDLQLVNAYANIEKGRWRVLGSWTTHHSEVIEVGSGISNFFGPGGDRDFNVDFAYLFASYNFAENLNLYGRYEKLKTDHIGIEVAPFFEGLNFDSRYSRKILGAKYEFAERQAITLEFTDQDSFGHSQNAVHLSWSAAFDWDL